MSASERRSWAVSAPPLLALAVSLVIRSYWWFSREYLHDDFFFGYLSWLRSTNLRPAIDYYVPSFMCFAELWAPVAGLAPESFASLIAARALILVISAVLLYLTFLLVRELGGSVEWALTAAAVVSWQPDFIVRIADIRADPLSALFLLMSILAILRRKPAVAGVLAGIATVFSVKLVIALPFLAITVFLVSPQSRIRSTVVLAIFTTLPAVAYVAWRVAADGWSIFESVLRDTAAGSQASSVTSMVMARSLRESPWPWVAIAAGAIALIADGVHKRQLNRLAAYCVLTLAFVTAFVIVNPFIYPYVAVMLLPLLAPLVSGIDIIAGRWRVPVIVVLLTLLIFSSRNAILQTIYRTNAAQRAVIEWMWRATSPSETVFDWVGMHLGRRGIFHWHMYSGWVQRYRSGWYSVADEWKRNRVSLIFDDYRLRWMTARDAEYLQSHYVGVNGCAFFPGRIATGPTTFDVIVPGTYRVLAPSGVRIDGTPAARFVNLGGGLHQIEPAAGGRAVLIYTTPLREAAGVPPCPAYPLLSGF